MDSVESALDVREEKTDLCVVVKVVEPFASEKCGEVLAAVFCSESVLVGAVSVSCFEVRCKCYCVESFDSF